MIKGTFFNIQRYTIHDGPGIRTEIFLKGCPLSCKWCSNPESHKSFMQPGVYKSKCLGGDKCGLCKKACSENCLIFKNMKLISINRDKCTGCMKCADICPADAIKRWGEKISTDKAMEIIRKDISYYKRSGGGVTISGGEPLMQPEFVKALLKKCKAENIHTCVETTLCTDWDIIKEILPFTDLFITDIKHMNSNIHKKHTGIGNEKILDNIERIVNIGKPLIIRIPVIPYVNDNIENISAVADFILNRLDNKILQLQLLEFMRLGEEKYTSLGIDYPMKDLRFDKDEFTEKIKDFANYFNNKGINTVFGTNAKEKK